MKISKVFFCLTLVVAILLGTASQVSATEYKQTIVDGVVYGPDGSPVSSGSVYVTCGTGTQQVTILSDGSYHAFFPQSVCKAGNLASAQATAPEGQGSNSAKVMNSVVNGPRVDIDIAVVNVNIAVPEFGAVTGMMSVLGAAASYVYIKSKEMFA